MKLSPSLKHTKKRSVSDSKRNQDLDFACEQLESRVMLSVVQIDVAGVTGEESISLEVAGSVVQTFNNLGSGANDGDFVQLTYSTDDNVSANDVRIVFTNDLFDLANGIDRNVRVDAISIDGQRFETESPLVFSTGTWLPADGIAPGFRESEFLHANGYFQYAEDSTGDGSVLINEIHYNPGPNEDGDAEFVELYNPGTSSIDLSGMSFVGFDLTFDDGVSLGAGQYAIVAPSIALAESTWGVTPIQEFEAGGISGGGELIQLIAADGVTVVDEVNYDDASPWPGGPDGNGPSLELFNPNFDNALAENWGTSDGTATPGAQNSIFGEDNTPDITNITVNPGVVLPNESFNISADINNATTATLYYRVMFGEEQSVTMTNTSGNTWTATLPGQDSGTLVRYRIESDVEIAPFDGESINYFGLVVSPTDVVDNSLPLLHLFYNPDDLALITAPENVLEKIEIETVVALGDQVIDNATMRVRGGDYARVTFPKQSFKIELPSGYEIDFGDNFDYTVDEFAIQAEYADFSFVAADVSWDIFNAESETYAHSFYSRVEGNADFFGVYRVQELYDGRWRKENGIDDDQFFKAENGWTYAIEDGFEKKTPDDGDLTAIAEMKAVVESADSPAKTQWLYENVDIPSVVNYMAISAMIRHGDQQVHNFYMTLDGETNLWKIIQWDLDQTWRDVFGGPTQGTDFTTLEPVNNVFMNSMWEVPEFQELYWPRLQTLVDKYLQDDQLIARREEIIEEIGFTNLDLENQTWGRANFYTAQEWEDSWVTGIRARQELFDNESRLPGSEPSNPNIVINELHYKPAGEDAEFLELYNASNFAVDVSDWTIDGVDLEIQKGTVILPGEYLVFTDNAIQFANQLSSANVYIGGQYDGGLKSAGETISLLDENGNLVDQVSYTNAAPWATGADGTGLSLSLISPQLDNSQAENWQVSGSVNGTPGAENNNGSGELATVTIFAAGSTGNENLTLEVAGQQVANFTLSDFGGQAGDLQARQFTSLTWIGNTELTAGDVRIYFTNDVYDSATDTDSNLGIDRIEIDGEAFQPEAPSVFSTGTWLPADGIEPGNRQSEVLHTNGYFQFAAVDLLQPGNTIQLFNDYNAAWLSGIGRDARTSTTNNSNAQWKLIDAAGSNRFLLRNIATGRYLDGDFFGIDTHQSSFAFGIVWEFKQITNETYHLYNTTWRRYVDSNGPNATVRWDVGSLDPDDRWTVTLV